MMKIIMIMIMMMMMMLMILVMMMLMMMMMTMLIIMMMMMIILVSDLYGATRNNYSPSSNAKKILGSLKSRQESEGRDRSRLPCFRS
jgi:ABC-type multidrug transport system fused ATPase/permease subunit